MLGQAAAKALLERVLSYSTADQTEVLLLARYDSLTRYANSVIHQNVAETDTTIRVRAVVGQKIGVASTNELDEASLKRVADTALAIAAVQNDNPDFHSLPGPASYAAVDAYVESTARFTPEQRAKAVGIACHKASQNGLMAAGTFSTGSQEIAIANSLGVMAYHPATSAEMIALMMSDSGSGYADFCSLDATAIDVEAIADEAVEKALRSRNPISLEPGDYEVVLQEYAAEDILASLGSQGFSALAVQEGRSFMRLGEKVVGDNISIWDDGLSPDSLPLPFDFEGVPKRRVDLIEKGVATAVVYDSYTAGKDGKVSTGHGLPAPNPMGPLPINLFMQTGTATKDEMVKGIKRGLWVTRFHYTRPVHPLKVIITGMTRDGTFLIENGELARPVKNLRYTQSYLEALSNVVAIGREAKLQQGYWGAGRVPALRISKFTFTGATEF